MALRSDHEYVHLTASWDLEGEDACLGLIRPYFGPMLLSTNHLEPDRRQSWFDRGREKRKKTEMGG